MHSLRAVFSLGTLWRLLILQDTDKCVVIYQKNLRVTENLLRKFLCALHTFSLNQVSVGMEIYVRIIFPEVPQ